MYGVDKIKRPGSLARAFYLLLKQGGDMKSVIDAGTIPKSSQGRWGSIGRFVSCSMFIIINGKCVKSVAGI